MQQAKASVNAARLGSGRPSSRRRWKAKACDATKTRAKVSFRALPAHAKVVQIIRTCVQAHAGKRRHVHDRVQFDVRLRCILPLDFFLRLQETRSVWRWSRYGYLARTRSKQALSKVPSQGRVRCFDEDTPRLARTARSDSPQKRPSIRSHSCPFHVGWKRRPLIPRSKEAHLWLCTRLSTFPNRKVPRYESLL